jgi:ribosomal protein S18 acetylase RimI-like enzyme
VELRRSRPDDVPAIGALVEAAYAPWATRVGRRPAPMDADHAGPVSEGGSWVAEADGRIAGVLEVRPERGHLLLEDVAVHPDRQGEGIGRALIAHAEALAVEAGLPEVRLYTNERMHENVALYAELGYQETGRGEQDGFRRVFLRKRL